jgi:hypothetical protein
MWLNTFMDDSMKKPAAWALTTDVVNEPRLTSNLPPSYKCGAKLNVENRSILRFVTFGRIHVSRHLKYTYVALTFYFAGSQ